MKIYKEIIEGKEITIVDMQNAEIHYKGIAIHNKTDDVLVINGYFKPINSNESEDYPIAD